ncbi:hypothetical protein [Bradyrhizobium sp. USDA 4486]
MTGRTKIYERKCAGLYLSNTADRHFLVQIHRPADQQARHRLAGRLHPETFIVEDARGKVYGLKGMGAKALAETFRGQKAKAAQNCKTVSEIIEERIDWMKTPVRSRTASGGPGWRRGRKPPAICGASLGARLGKKLAREVTKNDIATLSKDIVAGEFGKPSVSNGRNMRKVASALFNWAAEAGRDYVSASPCLGARSIL